MPSIENTPEPLYWWKFILWCYNMRMDPGKEIFGARPGSK
jgi:hypothetical protein